MRILRGIVEFVKGDLVSETGTRPSRAEKKAATREVLLEAGCRIVRDEGFAALTLSRVADVAGLTKGAIYSNFDSKEDLLLEVVDRLTPGLNFTDEVADAGRLGDLLDRLATALLRIVHTRQTEVAFALEFEMFALRDPRVREALVRQHTEGEDDPDVRRWLEAQGEEAGIGADALVEVLNAVSWGLVLRRLVHGEEALSDEAIRWAVSRFGGVPPSSH